MNELDTYINTLKAQRNEALDIVAAQAAQLATAAHAAEQQKQEILALREQLTKKEGDAACAA
jgi:hypothetical protein